MKNDAYTRAYGARSATARIEGAVANHDGGAVFEIGDMAQARRFLIIGTTGGTYYQGEREITRENADVIRKLALSQPIELAELIADISERGLAPKIDPQLFALAIMTSESIESRRAAFDVFTRVIRTGGHLLQWARYHKALGGKVNRSWRRAVSGWLLGRSPDALAYQLAKYRQRDGWSMKDLIDMSHALSGGIASFGTHYAAMRWARTGELEPEAPSLLHAFEKVRAGELAAEVGIREGLSWEMLPDEHLRLADIWVRLLRERKLPLTAALRNLARMTNVGALDPYFTGETADALRAMFGDERALRGARVHPINLLVALRQYEKGETRSGLRYTPVAGVRQMLDSAFYKAFETAEASGKRHLVGVDISSSMTRATPFGLTSHEIATVLAMKILRTEPASIAVGFANQIRELGMHAGMDLQAALRTTQGSFGSTNPSALIAYASGHKIPVDTFVVITDNEVNSGYHVPDALRNYRKASGIDAKLIVLATTATRFSIADPKDAGMLDIAGFGSDVPALLTEFSRGL